jgi:hypothetical protein
MLTTQSAQYASELGYIKTLVCLSNFYQDTPEPVHTKTLQAWMCKKASTVMLKTTISGNLSKLATLGYAKIVGKTANGKFLYEPNQDILGGLTHDVITDIREGMSSLTSIKKNCKDFAYVENTNTSTPVSVVLPLAKIDLSVVPRLIDSMEQCVTLLRQLVVQVN